MQDFNAFANSLTLEQLKAFKARAYKAWEALNDMEAHTANIEVLSEYIGQSFSNIVAEVENLSCAMDSRISELEDGIKKLTISDLGLIKLADA